MAADLESERAFMMVLQLHAQLPKDESPCIGLLVQDLRARLADSVTGLRFQAEYNRLLRAGRRLEAGRHLAGMECIDPAIRFRCFQEHGRIRAAVPDMVVG